MKKIYIVLVRRFFNNNGTDYAMSIDAVGDIHVFTSKKKALSFHETLIEKCKNAYKVDANEISPINFGSKSIKTTEFIYDNTRIYISTIIKEVN